MRKKVQPRVRKWLKADDLVAPPILFVLAYDYEPAADAHVRDLLPSQSRFAGLFRCCFLTMPEFKGLFEFIATFLIHALFLALYT